VLQESLRSSDVNPMMRMVRFVTCPPLFFFACQRNIPHIKKMLTCKLSIDTFVNQQYLLCSTWPHRNHKFTSRGKLLQ